MSIKLPVINVKKFGAVGDGVTDDTVAFNAAVTASVSYFNNTIIVPHGKYRISGTITVPAGIMFEGPGPGGK